MLQKVWFMSAIVLDSVYGDVYAIHNVPGLLLSKALSSYFK